MSNLYPPMGMRWAVKAMHAAAINAMTEILLQLGPWKGSSEAEVPAKITKRGSTRTDGRHMSNSLNGGCCVGDRAEVLGRGKKIYFLQVPQKALALVEFPVWVTVTKTLNKQHGRATQIESIYQFESHNLAFR